MRGPRPGEASLLEQWTTEVRGPRRHALFAAWLTSRICLDMAGGPAVAGRNERRRLQALRKRLGSLSLPVAFRRALHEIIEELGGGAPDAPVTALDTLARVVRETLGDRPAAAIRLGLKHLRLGGPEGAAGGPDRTDEV